MFNLIEFLKNLIWPPKKEKVRESWPGCLEPLTDYRDILGSSLIDKTINLPATYKSPYHLKVKNQGGTSACVAYASSSLKEEKELREQNDTEFDPEWLYRECKKIDNYNGQGTYLNAALKVMLNKGIKPLGGTEANASKYRIGGFFRLDDLTPNGLKQAIIQWGLVLVGYSFSRQGWATKYVRPPISGEASTGHAVFLKDWDENYLIGQNSFGPEWGDKGDFYVSKNYQPFAAYALVVDLPNNWQELLNINVNIPKPVYIFRNNLGWGMTDNEIKILQDCLKSIGCFKTDQVSTGYFGPQTKEAVILFQLRYGINQTGFCGITTRAKLNELFGKENE